MCGECHGSECTKQASSIEESCGTGCVRVQWPSDKLLIITRYIIYTWINYNTNTSVWKGDDPIAKDDCCCCCIINGLSCLVGWLVETYDDCLASSTEEALR